jgi:hypothetical protein
VLVPDEVTGPYAAEMFRLVAGGATPGAVALWAARLPDEAKGIVTRIVRDEATGKRERRPVARVLSHSAIRLLLRSSVYVGRFDPDDPAHPGERGRWTPLVDDATWNAVQARLGTARRRSGPVSGAHLLTGMIACPRCGHRMAGWTQAQRWKRYRCNSFTMGGEKAARNCTTTISSAPVDDAVMEQVSALLAPLADGDPKLRQAMTRAWEALRKPTDAMAKERQRQIARARKDVDDARRRIGDAARLLVDGAIDRVAYAALSQAEQTRLEQAERLLAAPEIVASTNALPPLADVLAMVGGWETVLTTGPNPEKRELLRALIQSVTPRRVAHGKYVADVVWTELGKALQEAASAAA